MRFGRSKTETSRGLYDSESLQTPPPRGPDSRSHRKLLVKLEKSTREGDDCVLAETSGQRSSDANIDVLGL